jgi:hypothetical protein
MVYGAHPTVSQRLSHTRASTTLTATHTPSLAVIAALLRPSPRS